MLPRYVDQRLVDPKANGSEKTHRFPTTTNKVGQFLEFEVYAPKIS